MSAREPLAKAVGSLTDAVTELEAAEVFVPAYDLEHLRFLRAEVVVARRRAQKVLRALESVDES